MFRRIWRYVALTALLLGALVVWRFYGPENLAGLLGLEEDFFTPFTRPFFTIGSLEVTLPFLMKTAVFLALLTLVVRFSRRMLGQQVLARISLDEGQRFALERGFGYLIFSFGLLVGLQSVGLNLSSLAFLGGAIGIGVGFGLQTIARNFVSGLVLLLERPIKVGDRVEVGTLYGDVINIGSRATWIQTNDNIVVIVPNAEFIENRVINWTANDRRVRVPVPLGVSYGSDPERVRGILLRIAKEDQGVLAEPPSDVIFKGFGDSSLDFELRVWTDRQTRTPGILKSDLYFKIFQAFKEEGIEIPYPQRDVHIKTAPATVQIMTTDGKEPKA